MATTGKKGQKHSTKSTKNSHNGDVDHTPIILTDGSASIEFAEAQHYRRVSGTSTHRATDLRLVSVEANMVHTQGNAAGSTFCGHFNDSDNCVIEMVEQGNKGFIIHKFPDGVTTEIQFDHNVYRTGSSFPARGNGHRFGNSNRKPAKLLITVNGAQVHNCEHASKQGVEYTILDPHA